jgi:hypothetical protein
VERIERKSRLGRAVPDYNWCIQEAAGQNTDGHESKLVCWDVLEIGRREGWVTSGKSCGTFDVSI